MSDTTKAPEWRHALTINDDHGGNIREELRQWETIARHLQESGETSVSIRGDAISVTIETLRLHIDVATFQANRLIWIALAASLWGQPIRADQPQGDAAELLRRAIKVARDCQTLFEREGDHQHRICAELLLSVAAYLRTAVDQSAEIERLRIIAKALRTAGKIMDKRVETAERERDEWRDKYLSERELAFSNAKVAMSRRVRLEAVEARIAELEAAQQWRPVSEITTEEMAAGVEVTDGEVVDIYDMGVPGDLIHSETAWTHYRPFTPPEQD